MKVLQGQGVSSGIAIGEAHIFKTEIDIEIEKPYISKDDVDKHIKIFQENLTKLLEEYQNFYDNFSTTTEDQEIIQSYTMILEDPEFKKNIIDLIKENFYSAEKAVLENLYYLQNFFKNLENAYFRERIIDYEEISKALIDNILGIKHEIINHKNPTISIREEIFPYDVTKAQDLNISGICLKKGSRTSHSSIIARALGIPLVIGVKDIFENVKNKEKMIIDGDSGKIMINPDSEKIAEYNKIFSSQQEKLKILKKLTNVPTVTSDDRKILLKCNIEFEEEVENVLKYNTDGIGLFRTEFLFLKKNIPDEEAQCEIYQNIAKLIYPKSLTIRTIDLGGDKFSEHFSVKPEKNPYLGLRGIRFSLEYQDIFKTQLKAILRANQYGNIKIMFPMITGFEELMEAKAILLECQKELEKKNIIESQYIKVGVMIEVPAAALNSDLLARECDFFSIGTNDLIQYTLAADRNSDLVYNYYDAFNPAVLKLIKLTVDSAKNNKIPVSVCGEMAAEEKLVPLLIGIGIDELSVGPGAVLLIKEMIISSHYDSLKLLADKCLRAGSSLHLKRILLEEMGG